jgi:hypothetical protein
MAQLYMADLNQKQQIYKQATDKGDAIAQAEALAQIKNSVASAA